MSTEASPQDLVALFGLSPEEALGLGLDRHDRADALGSETSVLPPAPTVRPLAMLAPDLLTVFSEESVELLDSLHTALEQLESSPAAEAVIDARRAVHTLKGGARVCGLTAISDLAHACEDAIGPARAGEQTLPEILITFLFQAEHELREVLTAGNTPEGEERLRELAASLRALALPRDTPSIDAPAHTGSQVAPPVTVAQAPLLRRPNIASVAPSKNRLAVDAGKVEGVVAKVTEIVSNRAVSHSVMETLAATVGESLRTVERLQHIATHLHYQIVSQGLDMTVQQGPDGLEVETYGPIHQWLLQLQEAASDQQALVQATMDIVTNKRSLAAVESRLDADLQQALLQLRLLPLGHLRVRLDQVVRSTAAAAGREVQWVMEGQDVALDKQVTDSLFEPLMHLLRNAIDHGIEPPAERVALGKPRAGALVVRAQVEGNQASITVRDDGRGIDPSRVVAAAVTQRLIDADQARLLSEREQLDLLFRPGLSTATRVTELSGRGMGMDIVKEACTRLGGTISIVSQPGQGTTVTLQVPLSMSVLHALVVQAAGYTLVIPASQVRSVQLVPATALYEQDGRRWIHIGREDLPFYQFLALAGALESTVDAVPGECTVLVVPYQGGLAALAVDDLLNEEDVTVKPLPALLQGVTRFLGSVILADGIPAPVLNVPPMLEWLEQDAQREPTVRLTLPQEQTVLVVDDSLTIRYALAQTLEQAGLKVVTVRDGREAIEAVRMHGVPRLVTLDIEMPRMDGFETLYALRHTEGAEHIPIFVLTSRSGQQHHRTALQLGATKYFTKPYHDGEFLRAVQEALGLPARAAG
jgi:chemosensory pili system protein ChpA (sensor histidine kinase/response regulator)